MQLPQRTFWFGFFILVGLILRGQDTLLLQATQPRQNVPDSTIWVWVDSFGQESISSISQRESGWLPYSAELQKKFPPQSTVWARLHVRTEAPDSATWALQLGGYPDLATAYQTHPAGWDSVQSGKRRPRSEKQILVGYSQFVTLRLAGDTTTTLFLRHQELEKSLPAFRLAWRTIDSFRLDQANLRTNILSANLVVLSILTIMMLYHLMLFVTIRERSYLYYCLYVLTVDLVILVDGILQPFNLSPGGPMLWSYLVYVGLGMISVFYYMFTRSFLETASLLPRWDKAIRWMIGLKIAAIVAGSLIRYLFANPEIAEQILGLLFLVDVPFLFVFFVPLYRSGSQPSRYFIVATGIVFLFGFTLVAFGRRIGIEPFIPFTLAFIAHILVFSLGLGARLRGEQEAKLDAQEALNAELKKINEATSRFVPYEFLRSLGKESVLDVELGDGVEKEVSVFFSDIRSYTTLSEKMSPQENFEFLNQYLGRVGPIIQTHDGFVNQYYGDGIMALFQASPLDALQASIEIHQNLHEFNQWRSQQAFEPIRIGIGLHTGSLLMGVIGDAQRMDASVVSDTVNTAARMEGLTKLYGASIVLSEKSMQQIPEAQRPAYRYLGRVQVKGRAGALGIYECFAGDPVALQVLKTQTLAHFEAALKAYQNQQFAEAIRQLEKLLQHSPQDQAARHYLHLCRAYQQHPPPADWEGVETMLSK